MAYILCLIGQSNILLRMNSQVRNADFDPTNADGTPFYDAFGVGLWRHTEAGYFGGGP